MGETVDAADRPDLVLLTVLVVGVLLVLAIGGQLLAPGTAVRDTATVRLSIAAAYIGGLLAFLSPCSVAVIPGILTYGLDGEDSLVRQTYVFYLGLALVFVPLGFGLSVVGQALRTHQMLLTWIAGGVMVAMGAAILLQVDLFGWMQRLGGPALDRADTETGRTFVLGAFFGFATSSCTAPILAGIAVLSVGAGLAPLEAMLLFLVFALGIVTPLFPLAWAGDRSAFLDRLKGGRWEVEIGGSTHKLVASKVVAGIALVAVGVLFVATNGTRGLLGIYDAIGATALYETLDAAVREALAGWPGQVATLIGLVVAGVLAWRWRRAAPEGDDT